LQTAQPGKYTDGGGLVLDVKRSKSGRITHSWGFRFTLAGKRREMGIGSSERFTLSQARQRASELSQLVARGIDPIEQRAEQARQLKAKRDVLTFKAMAHDAFEAHKATLKGDGKASRWFGPVRLHLLPSLGERRITEIDQRDLADTLRPIWKAKHPTAKKCLDRVSVIYRYAAASGLNVDMQIAEKARALLGAHNHVVKNHPALPADEASRLFQSLDMGDNGHRALALYLLSGGGARLKPLRELNVSNIHGDHLFFPGEEMKGLRGRTDDFRLPVTRDMEPILERAAQDCVGGFLFSSSRLTGNDHLDKHYTAMARSGRVPVIADNTMEEVMRRRERDWRWAEPFRLHGVRASFRSWASETNPALYAVAEAALAHKVGDAIERTYQRHDFLGERRDLLEQWANHLTGRTGKSGVVVAMKGR